MRPPGMTGESGRIEGPPPPERETVSTLRVACDGGGGALGHPRVWLSIDPRTGWVECSYCDKRYVYSEA